MKEHIYFGETVKGYDIPVLNEREARAAAGILFLFGMIGFLNAYLLHDFIYTQIFVTYFMIDFTIRVFINPKYAPSLILGRFFVSNQRPEYVGAKQKRFAWSIGFALSIPMFIMIVILGYMTPVKIVICIICLMLLFFEAAFSICIGCKLYALVYGEKAEHCPGGICDIKQKEEIQKISKFQAIVLGITLIIVSSVAITKIVQSDNSKSNGTMKCGVGKCGGN